MDYFWYDNWRYTASVHTKIEADLDYQNLFDRIEIIIAWGPIHFSHLFARKPIQICPVRCSSHKEMSDMLK